VRNKEKKQNYMLSIAYHELLKSFTLLVMVRTKKFFLFCFSKKKQTVLDLGRTRNVVQRWSLFRLFQPERTKKVTTLRHLSVALSRIEKTERKTDKNDLDFYRKIKPFSLSRKDWERSIFNAPYFFRSEISLELFELEKLFHY